MPANLLTNILHLTSTQLDLINDGFIGSTVSTGTGAQPYPGQLGGLLFLSEAEAALLCSSAIVLHEGIYQYVQFVTSQTSTNVAAQVYVWSTRASYVVTSDVAATTFGEIAGISIGAVTKGNYGIIQIAGTANVKYKSSLTAATPAIGDLVILDQSATTAGAFADDPTQSGNPTYTILKSVLGVAQAAPVGAATSLVQLTPRFKNL